MFAPPSHAASPRKMQHAAPRLPSTHTHTHIHTQTGLSGQVRKGSWQGQDSTTRCRYLILSKLDARARESERERERERAHETNLNPHGTKVNLNRAFTQGIHGDIRAYATNLNPYGTKLLYKLNLNRAFTQGIHGDIRTHGTAPATDNPTRRPRVARPRLRTPRCC